MILVPCTLLWHPDVTFHADFYSLHLDHSTILLVEPEDLMAYAGLVTHA